jgi:hypothetical protein
VWASTAPASSRSTWRTEAGVDHIVVDLRLQFDRFEETVEVIGKQVLPQLATVVPG